MGKRVRLSPGTDLCLRLTVNQRGGVQMYVKLSYLSDFSSICYSAIKPDETSDKLSYWCCGVDTSDIDLDALGYSLRSYVFKRTATIYPLWNSANRWVLWGIRNIRPRILAVRSVILAYIY